MIYDVNSEYYLTFLKHHQDWLQRMDRIDMRMKSKSNSDFDVIESN